MLFNDIAACLEITEIAPQTRHNTVSDRVFEKKARIDKIRLKNNSALSEHPAVIVCVEGRTTDSVCSNTATFISTSIAHFTSGYPDKITTYPSYSLSGKDFPVVDGISAGQLLSSLADRLKC